jgi:hypothetical protein
MTVIWSLLKSIEIYEVCNTQVYHISKLGQIAHIASGFQRVGENCDEVQA